MLVMPARSRSRGAPVAPGRGHRGGGRGGRRVVIRLQVRRLFCDVTSCGKRTFAEQVPGLTARYKGKTALLAGMGQIPDPSIQPSPTPCSGRIRRRSTSQYWAKCARARSASWSATIARLRRRMQVAVTRAGCSSGPDMHNQTNGFWPAETRR